MDGWIPLPSWATSQTCKKKDTEMCETEWRGNNEGLNFSLTFGKNSLGSIIGPLELFGNYWEVWVGNCGRQMKKTSFIMFNAQEAKLLGCMKSNKTGPHKKSLESNN